MSCNDCIKKKFRKLQRKMRKLDARHTLEVSDLKIELDNMMYAKDLAEAKLGLLRDSFDDYKRHQPVVVEMGEQVVEPIVEHNLEAFVN